MEAEESVLVLFRKVWFLCVEELRLYDLLFVVLTRPRMMAAGF